MQNLDLDSEARAFLEMARKLRYACTQRDEVVRRYRDRYDRSQDDLRMMPEKRVEIAGAFLQAAYKADHVYEDCLEEVINEYRELLVGNEPV